MVYIWLYFRRKYRTFEAERRKKTKKKLTAAAGTGRGMVAGLAAGRDEDGGGVWWYWLADWCGKSQRLTLYCFRWCFFMSLQTFFAPMRFLHRCRRCPGCWRRGGWRGDRRGDKRGGWQGDTPPLMVYVGTIEGFSLQKFFFGFRVALGGVGRLNLPAYIVECVQINREWDAKLKLHYL